MNPRAYRLPDHARPRRYEVHLDARVGQESFHGRLRLLLDVERPTRRLEMHARDLALSDARLRAGDREIAAAVRAYPERETVTFDLADEVPVGEAVLEVAFAGKISPSMEGLYVARDGPEVALATQCQETDARGVFPCFDEPAFKAEVAWTVTTDAEATVLTNGALVGVEEAPDGRRWRFAPTRPISTYLAAVTIGDYAAAPADLVRNVPLRVWALRGKENLGEFAQKFTARLLPWFEDYFDTAYPYGKYDQVAVPGFSAGAMENVGLVLFRQMYLLMNPRTASWAQEKQIARVVAHEFAHMWFGNLVTMRWWDDVWLNEAFAEWMAHKAVDALEPSYRIWSVQESERARALAMDALASTHAIYSPVETPEQATELFDAITYYKGAAVMRMLETFLGEAPFRAGLRAYMKEFAERNAAGADLWRHLAGASGEPVDAIMGAWIRTPGHPVVHVSLADGYRLRLRQERYFATPDAPRVDETWPVPLVVRFADDGGTHVLRHLLEGRDATLTLPVTGRLRWCTANADQVGVFRQDPDDALLEKLLAHRRHLTPSEQAGLLDDQWALVRSGTRPVTRFLDVLDALLDADDHVVVERVAEHLVGIEDQLAEADDPQALAAFRAWVVESLKPRLDALGLEARPGEARANGLKRAALVRAVAAVGEDAGAIAACVGFAEREAGDPAAVDPDVAVACINAAARFGDRARLDRHVKLYVDRRAAAASPQETGRYLTSLTAFAREDLVRRVLELVDEQVVPQEAVGPLLRSMLAERHGRLPAWEWVKSNWEFVRTRLGDLWTGALVDASGNLPPTHRQELAAFYAANLRGVAEQASRRAIETLDQRTAFRARTREHLVGWFRQRASG